MGLPAGYPTADASFDSVDFWELQPDGRYADYSADEERTIIGQTVVTRYTKPREVTIQGLASIADAESLDSRSGVTASLVWHRGTTSATLTRVSTKQIPALGVAEVTLTVIV